MNRWADDEDVSLTEGPDGHALAHRVDCPEVDRRRREGEPIATLIGLQRPLPAQVARHSCLLGDRSDSGV